jgi:KaiC/GvpD/RAD55 family RecA-like ATPase
MKFLSRLFRARKQEQKQVFDADAARAMLTVVPGVPPIVNQTVERVMYQIQKAAPKTQGTRFVVGEYEAIDGETDEVVKLARVVKRVLEKRGFTVVLRDTPRKMTDDGDRNYVHLDIFWGDDTTSGF